jgi:hypothetical protein
LYKIKLEFSQFLLFGCDLDFNKNSFDCVLQASLPEDEKSLMGSLEQLQRQLIDTPSSWPSRKSPKLKNISLDEDDTLVGYEFLRHNIMYCKVQRY